MKLNDAKTAIEQDVKSGINSVAQLMPGWKMEIHRRGKVLAFNCQATLETRHGTEIYEAEFTINKTEVRDIDTADVLKIFHQRRNLAVDCLWSKANLREGSPAERLRDLQKKLPSSCPECDYEFRFEYDSKRPHVAVCGCVFEELANARDPFADTILGGAGRQFSNALNLNGALVIHGPRAGYVEEATPQEVRDAGRAETGDEG